MCHCFARFVGQMILLELDDNKSQISEFVDCNQCNHSLCLYFLFFTYNISMMIAETHLFTIRSYLEHRGTVENIGHYITNTAKQEGNEHEENVNEKASSGWNFSSISHEE